MDGQGQINVNKSFESGTTDFQTVDGNVCKLNQ